MSSSPFILSAFGDEIASDFGEQLQHLGELCIAHLEFRSAWGKNVLALSDDEVAAVREGCLEAGISVSCIGSPIGKTPITDPLDREMANLSRIFDIAEKLQTCRVRVFSFYPPDAHDNSAFDAYVEAATVRLAHLADLARREGFQLLLENEKAIVGDTPQRCQAIVSGVDSPNLRFLWDPANFVQVGVGRPMDEGWSLLSDYVDYVHVKDALLVDGSIRAAGEGDGQLRELLIALQAMDYQCCLALEPHLSFAGRSGGFSGPDGMRYAVSKLRQLLRELGGVESIGGES